MLTPAAHTKHQKQYASLETSLKHLAKDTEVGESVFFHIMANPEVNRKINALNSYIAGNQELVESLTERIGIMAKTSGDAFSMLIPGYNHLADFIRGVALYAFKNVMVKGPGTKRLHNISVLDSHFPTSMTDSLWVWGDLNVNI